MSANMARKNFNTTIDEATIAVIERLAVGKSKGEVIDQAVALLACPPGDLPGLMRQLARETWARLDEILETVQAVQPEPEELRPSFSPASIPGVNMGAGNLKPRRESSFEQASREEREKEQRSRARSNVGDDPTYTFDPEFVQE